MKLIFEDDSFDRAEKDWLYPRSHFYDSEDSFTGTVEAKVVDKLSGKAFTVVATKYGSGLDIDDFIDNLKSNAEDIILDEMDSDSRFDDYDDFSEFDIEITDVSADFGTFNESILHEADENMLELVKKSLDAVLTEFEKALPDKIAQGIESYDKEWYNGKTVTGSTMKDAYIDEIIENLFANFNR